MKRYKRPYRPGLCLIPGYRYCGPGCSGPGTPVNAVDAPARLTMNVTGITGITVNVT
ncbi:MAG: hypothetical protein WAM18_11040 [Halobacillus sp.]|uniref:hypothetical protein n=1 Tax=Halobacillus sp. TaxID=56800 RepID=UPI003BB0CCB6